VPAEADKSRMVATARGGASKITEDGKATAIRSLGATWAQAGDSARQIFVAQKLSRLVETMSRSCCGPA
jgi:flotillin